jgi:hypothetical protein
MAGAVMAQDAGQLAHLLRWCGIALVAAGGSMVVTTPLHPSRETATTIVSSEPRLVAAHVVYTLAWLLVLLGLPRTLRGATRCDGPAGTGQLLDRFHRHLSDRNDGKRRFPRPGLGQTVACGVGLH